MNMSRLLLALLFIGLGVVFLLSNFDVIDIDVGDLFSVFWPLIIIWIGLSMIITAFKYRRGRWDVSGASIIIGALITLFGWSFLADNLDLPTISFGFIWNLFWPLLLIYIGLKIIFRKSGRMFDVHITSSPSKTPDDVHSETNELQRLTVDENEIEEGKVSKKRKRKYKGIFIGEINMGKDLYEFEDLHLWNGIGDVELDLTRAILPEDEARILITGWIGDVKIIVPKDIPVFIEANVRVGDVRIFDWRESGMLLSDKTYKSPDYDDAIKKVHIVVELKIGDIRVIDR